MSYSKEELIELFWMFLEEERCTEQFMTSVKRHSHLMLSELADFFDRSPANCFLTRIFVWDTTADGDTWESLNTKWWELISD